MNEKLWAVCLYVQGGPSDGTYIMEFVQATDRDHAVSQAINLNETGDCTFETVAAAAYEEQ